MALSIMLLGLWRNSSSNQWQGKKPHVKEDFQTSRYWTSLQFYFEVFLYCPCHVALFLTEVILCFPSALRPEKGECLMQLMPQPNTKIQYMGIKENCLHQAWMLPALFQTASSPKTAGSGLHEQHFPVLKFISQHSEQRGNSARAEGLNFN